MKKLYFLIIALCFFTTVKSQIVNIPDVVFKSMLLEKNTTYSIAKNLAGKSFIIDANFDGEIQQSEALEVKELYIYYTNVSNLTGIEYFKNLTSLTCIDSRLTSLDTSSNTALTYLNLGSNFLTNLNVSSNASLAFLYCNNNQLISLNLGSINKLIDLSCSSNKLTNLDVSSNTSLTTLNCYQNQLTSLNVSNTALTFLECSQNKLTSLDVNSNKTLTSLICSYNQITSLNVSNNKALIDLQCHFNRLTNLDLSSNIALKYLYCFNNQLTSLDLSNNTALNDLQCYFNLLTSLDVNSNTALFNLQCYNNQLISLNVSNNILLNILECNSNKLTSLFIKNGKNEAILKFSNNPNLQYICADEGQISDVQNKINSYGYVLSCHVNSYCSFIPGGLFYTFQGTNKFDTNSNGCDGLDNFIPKMKFIFAGSTFNGNIISNTTGFYSTSVQAGTHTITPVFENPAYFNVSPTTATITFPATTSPFVQDFCITANGVHPDLEITLLLLNRARPGFDSIFKIVYKNKGNTTQSGSVNLVFDDAVLDLIVANPITTTQTTNNLSWNFTNLLPFETREIIFTLNVNSPVEIPAVNNGDILAFKATINSSANDETPIDNTFVFNQTVVNSFDPNDKTCLEGTTITPSLIGQYVHYIIRFENNGTANAQNIVVKDMIDLSKFDISTLIPINASHSFVTNVSAGNKVEFIFENITLPFDDANNDGYIAFKIKTLPTLVVGNTFTNDASIYFDYNFPVVTKLASSTFKTLGTPDFEFSNYFTLYPNPVKSVLNIGSKETIEVKSISIYDNLGQLILVIPNAEKISEIDVSSLTIGNYFIKINSDKGSSNTRFIKE